MGAITVSEENILYPSLDKVAGEEERWELLSKCSDVDWTPG
jgi:hypothetical protein